MQCCLIKFYPQLLSKLKSVFSNPAAALSTKLVKYSQSFTVISTVFTGSSPGLDSISRNHFLCSSKKQLLIHSSFRMIVQQFRHIFRLHFYFQFTCHFYHIYSYFFPKVMKPSEPSMRVKINFSQTPAHADILTSSCEL